MTTWAQVAECISANDAAGVVRACSGLSEAERRALAADAVALYHADWLNVVAGLAVLATGARSDMDRLWGFVLARQPDESLAILVDRQPAWLRVWLTSRMGQEPHCPLL